MKLMSLWLLAAALCVLMPVARRGSAQEVDSNPVDVTTTPTGVRFRWDGTIGRAANGEPTVKGWDRVALGSLSVPAQLVAVHVASDRVPELRITRLQSDRWLGTIGTAAPRARGAGPTGRRPQPTGTTTLPTSPVTVVRDGFMRGQRIVVVAVHPLFLKNGVPHAATGIEAFMPNASVLDQAELKSTTNPFSPAGTKPALNEDAVRTAWVIKVEHAGMQRLDAAALTRAGINLATINTANLQLRWRGQDVALEERHNADGTLADLSFYAPEPGDRWNSADSYWLTLRGAPGKRITQRSVERSNALTRASAFTYGTWRGVKLYDSTLAGVDGDHWFGAALRSDTSSASTTVPLSPTLPLLATGTTTLTLAVSMYTPHENALKVTLGASTWHIKWGGPGEQQLTAELPATGSEVQLTALTAPSVSGILLDRLTWYAPALLTFAGRGAFFDGVAGRWRYQLSETAPTRALYDITNPRAPQRIVLTAGQNPSFEDGPDARRYLLTGPGTAWAPTIERHAPTDLTRSPDADALYIAPADLHDALTPLLELRRQQGKRVEVIDLDAIYDTWNWGDVAPEAIRHFLQYGAEHWSLAPEAVTLVGDGTSDPHNYLGFGQRVVVPPFLAMVDPWMGETACETCFGQLDGADPLDDPLPDVQVGRLPVASAAELRSVVAKLVAYETAPADSRWQRRSLIFTDNYREANGTVDGAGDFAAFAENAAALQPPGIETTRVYYDPYKPTSTEPGHEPNAVRAHERVMDALDRGVGIATYIGHAHYYQLAVTDLGAKQTSLLGLYDVDRLRNAPRLPIMLQMTCLTSAFFQPNFSGMTIDERLLRHPSGGAAAVWGPTGLGLAYGHEQLSRGFNRELWSKQSERPTMGELTHAGYLDLFTTGHCCQESLRTFALLGDPLTIPRAAPGFSVYVPMVRR